MTGLDTDSGRMVIVSPRDLKQPELPVQILVPGESEYQDVPLSMEAPAVLSFVMSEQTPFGLNQIGVDHVALVRI